MATPVVPTYNLTMATYRPFGTTTTVNASVPCAEVPNMACGRNSSYSGLTWTHIFFCADTWDIIDGCTRSIGSNGLNYGDGDEIRCGFEFDGTTQIRYVVVFVERWNDGVATAFKRIYAMRQNG